MNESRPWEEVYEFSEKDAFISAKWYVCKRENFAEVGMYYVFVEDGRSPSTLFVHSQNTFLL